MHLKDRVVFITGASRGIGAELARDFAAHGARLGLVARNIEALAELAGELPSDALPVPCDIRDEEALGAACRKVADHFGTIDSVVANAGVALESGRAHKVRTETWIRTLETNLTGPFLTARAAHPYLAASGRGRLVLTSSVIARQPRPGLSAYAASKAGVEGLTRALAADWAKDGICVNAVAPGFFGLGMGAAFEAGERLRDQVIARTVLGRFGEPQDIAGVVRFLASDAAAYVNGQVLGVDGGYGLGV
ncbi:SDR family NAD(P)-dependent oxidoreductase [Amycolatopsis thermoflava]|uniref:3-oxoacyl-[acyl-carrier protein] reductase n=1 Tax=Amycolatopsis thermoflava TaxID=84480 RepID=A0A3N2GVY6_9PSEU|nr:SDR family NAD(P)-dependent oxidoreductase [Amycolatopsis thermoflava]ROS40717.1 3-oxoacyl-[acyl-carrier protein] reductase [Amycolatopsis thermoflava]